MLDVISYRTYVGVPHSTGELFTQHPYTGPRPPDREWRYIASQFHNYIQRRILTRLLHILHLIYLITLMD